MNVLVKALHEDTDFQLDLVLLAGRAGLMRAIQHNRVQKPGLAIAGLIQAIRPDCLQVLGRSEIRYLESLAVDARVKAAELLFGSGIAGAVTTTDLEPPPYLLDLAERYGIALFRTTLPSGAFINRVHDFLDEHLSQEVTLHAVLLDVFGVGVMLTGPSGIGKSECALDLILRGHRLVADDAVLVKQYKQQLEGMGSPLTRHHMEVRGLGIINVQDLFGSASVRERKRIELAVELHELTPGAEYDRTGIDDNYETILGIDVPRVKLPVRPGRNIASIVEVAARNHLLKLQGHHSAREFKEMLERQLEAAAAEAGGAGGPLGFGTRGSE